MNFKTPASAALRIFLFFAITLIMFSLGAEAKLHLSEQAVIGISVAAYAVFTLFLLLFLSDSIGGRRIQKEPKSVKEWQNFLLSRKEAAGKSSDPCAAESPSIPALSFSWRFIPPLRTALICRLFFSCFPSIFIYSRGQSDTKRFDFPSYISPDEYPVLHQTAYRAAIHWIPTGLAVLSVYL